MFKRDRTSKRNEHLSGRPVEVTTPEMIDKIHYMVLSDRRIKMREIVEARYVSRLLSEENKRNRVVEFLH